MSLNEVCRRVSVSKPFVYSEFGGEDGLVEAVLGHYRAAVVVPVLELLEMELPFADVMEAIIIGMTTEREHPPGCLFTEMRLLRRHLGPRSEAALDLIEAERRGAFEVWYAHALERGEANPALSPSGASNYIDAQFSMVLLHMGMGQPAEAVREAARFALGTLAS